MISRLLEHADFVFIKNFVMVQFFAFVRYCKNESTLSKEINTNHVCVATVVIFKSIVYHGLSLNKLANKSNSGNQRNFFNYWIPQLTTTWRIGVVLTDGDNLTSTSLKWYRRRSFKFCKQLSGWAIKKDTKISNLSLIGQPRKRVEKIETSKNLGKNKTSPCFCFI